MPRVPRHGRGRFASAGTAVVCSHCNGDEFTVTRPFWYGYAVRNRKTDLLTCHRCGLQLPFLAGSIEQA